MSQYDQVSGTQGVTLRLAEAQQKDVGRGVARIDPADLALLGADVGDVVLLEGRRTTVARAIPLYVALRGRGLVQVDGIVRANARAGLDERVVVQRVEVQPARTVVLAPTELFGAVPSNGAYLARLLSGVPVVVGDQVRANLLSARTQTFTVVETSPDGPVLIGAGTAVRLAGRGQEQQRGASTYEDIGGLHREMRRIREMIELPLRYPEVFEHLGIARAARRAAPRPARQRQDADRPRRGPRDERPLLPRQRPRDHRQVVRRERSPSAAHLQGRRAATPRPSSSSTRSTPSRPSARS